VLPFDDEDLAGATVADVLANPARFEGATLADPLEGVEYGACKAKIMRRADGSPWVHSFAHGRTIYELKFDARSAQATLRNAAAADVPSAFVHLVLFADLDEAEIEELRDIACERSRTGKRALDAMLKRARKEHTARQKCEQRARHAAERQASRPYLPAPFADAERLPVMTAIDDVLANQQRPEPPIRDTEGRLTEARCRAPIMLHDMLTVDANTGETDETDRPSATDHAAADDA
jgi:hypothetical protein